MSSSIYPLSAPQPLTEEEKQNRFAFLYDLPIPDPAQELIDAFTPGNMMDPADALEITEFEKLFLPDAGTMKNGYCMMPDGTCYSNVLVKMPDLTVEMEDYWNQQHWTSQDDVHYKVWFPGMHYSHQGPVVENLGWGAGDVNFAAPIFLADVLSASPEELNPDFVAFSGCAGFFVPHENPENVWYQTIANCVRKSPEGGLECQTINWSGIHLINGKPVRKIPEGETADLETARLFGCHNAWENTRKNQILPLVWEILQKEGS